MALPLPSDTTKPHAMMSWDATRLGHTRSEGNRPAQHNLPRRTAPVRRCPCSCRCKISRVPQSPSARGNGDVGVIARLLPARSRAPREILQNGYQQLRSSFWNQQRKPLFRSSKRLPRHRRQFGKTQTTPGQDQPERRIMVPSRTNLSYILFIFGVRYGNLSKV